MTEEHKINNLSKWEVCRVCLDTDVELFEMNVTLTRLYKQLTDNDAHFGEKMPRRVCRECFYRMISAVNFRMKAHQSHALLSNLLRSAMS